MMSSSSNMQRTSRGTSLAVLGAVVGAVLGAVVAACVAAPAAAAQAPVARDTIVTLAAGQTARVASGVTLTFVRVANDSRCPAGAQCVWAGELRIALSLNTNGETSAFDLSTMSEPSATVKQFSLAFVSTLACPEKRRGAAKTECAVIRVKDAAR